MTPKEIQIGDTRIANWPDEVSLPSGARIIQPKNPSDSVEVSSVNGSGSTEGSGLSPDQISPEILDKLKKLLEASSEPPQPVKQDSTPPTPKTVYPSPQEILLKDWIESGEGRRFSPGEEEDAKERKRLELEKGVVILPQRLNR